MARASYEKRATAKPPSVLKEKIFLLAPRTQWPVALRIAIDSRVRTKFMTLAQGISHFVASLAARRRRKCWPSRWTAPSVEHTNGVKSARRSADLFWCCGARFFTLFHCHSESHRSLRPWCKKEIFFLEHRRRPGSCSFFLTFLNFSNSLYLNIHLTFTSLSCFSSIVN